MSGAATRQALERNGGNGQKAPFRVLIIDDSAEDRETYRRYLGRQEQPAFEFFEAATAAEGLAAVPQFQPDCVLVDYCLPDRDGLELAIPLLAGRQTPAFAIVMLTGHGSEHLAVTAMKAGIQDYLIKRQVTKEGLCRAVRVAIEKVELLRAIEMQRQELEKLAMLDALTGLYNRRTFVLRLEEEVDRTQRYPVDLALLLVDLDHFKNINDQFGHLVGDQVLLAIAGVLRLMRKSDSVARFGGEEFAVLMPNTDVKGASIAAERLRQTVQANVGPSVAADFPVVTCSVGVAVLSGAAANGNELIRRADNALYQAKREGRNRVCLAPA